LLLEIIEKKNSLEIFSMFDIGIHEEYQQEFGQRLVQNQNLKLVAIKDPSLKNPVIEFIENNITKNKRNFIKHRISKNV